MRNPIWRRLCLLRWHRERASAKGVNGASLGAFAIALVACLPVASSATTPVDLCVGDPCVVSRRVSIDSGSDLDFGAAALVFAPEARVKLRPDGGTTTMRAASIVFEAGARVDGGMDGIRKFTHTRSATLSTEQISIRPGVTPPRNTALMQIHTSGGCVNAYFPKNGELLYPDFRFRAPSPSRGRHP